MYAASKTGGAARLNVRWMIGGGYEDFLSSVFCLLFSDSPVDGVACPQERFPDVSRGC